MYCVEGVLDGLLGLGDGVVGDAPSKAMDSRDLRTASSYCGYGPIEGPGLAGSTSSSCS